MGHAGSLLYILLVLGVLMDDEGMTMVVHVSRPVPGVLIGFSGVRLF